MSLKWLFCDSETIYCFSSETEYKAIINKQVNVVPSTFFYKQKKFSVLIFFYDFFFFLLSDRSLKFLTKPY